MQADNVRDNIKDLTERLTSLDPVQYDSAINQYFEANAVLDTQWLHTSGVSRIKKIAQLQNGLSTKSKVEQEPVYDDKKNIASFTISRTLQAPTLPAWIPLAHLVSNKSKVVHWRTDLHLNPAEDGNLYVTKAALTRKEQFPFESLIPFFILKPFLTLLVLFVANINAFFVRHQGKPAASVLLAAIAETVNGIWLFILNETGKRQAQAEAWSDEKRGQAASLYTSAMSAAASLQADLESRANAAGIPVDQYKSQIANTLEDFRAKAADLQTDIEGRAKKAGVPVEEYRRQVEEAIVELQKRAQGLGDYFDSKATEAREAYNRTTNDSNGGSPQKATFDGVPTTPLGGHDPTAPNAPSFAAAAAQ